MVAGVRGLGSVGVSPLRNRCATLARVLILSCPHFTTRSSDDVGGAVCRDNAPQMIPLTVEPQELGANRLI